MSNPFVMFICTECPTSVSVSLCVTPPPPPQDKGVSEACSVYGKAYICLHLEAGRHGFCKTNEALLHIIFDGLQAAAGRL